METPPNFEYVGQELDLFQHATHWKNYYAGQMKPFLKGDVLEVGAGLGGTTQVLCDGSQRSWLCLEPDYRLISQIESKIEAGQLPAICQAKADTIEGLPDTPAYDAILYIDVIEHIEDDAAELRQALKRLRPGGHLLIIVPAHQWLYSPFDGAVGHFRRYSKTRLTQAVPPGARLVSLRYLDSMGWLASCVNKLVLRQAYPTQKQVAFWDSTIVPVSTLTDGLVDFSFGKSLLGIWQKA